MKKIFLIILIFIVFLISPNVYAETFDELSSQYPYYISSYDIEIIVNENNTFDITEKLGVYFNTPRHGIFRTIPLRNEITRLDGTRSFNKAAVTNIYVNKKFTTSNNNGDKVIKIGDPNYKISGFNEYIIKYNYNIGKDTGKNYDELYFNIVGDKWDTLIKNISFSITMPKDFDESKIGFSSGVKGTIGSNNVNYKVYNNVITGNYDGIFNRNAPYAGEALTIRIELPEGYFVGAHNVIDLYSIFLIAISIIFMGVSILLWYLFGKDNKVIETVEFYPPENLNSAEVAYFYKGNVHSKDIVSLLIYLANKGYIKIEETKKENTFFNKKGFKIIKIKDYQGDNLNEERFLNGLFKPKKLDSKEIQEYDDENIEKIGDKLITEVTDEELEDNFYKVINAIKRNLNSKKNKREIFEKQVFKYQLPIIFMIIALCISIIIPTIEYYPLMVPIMNSVFIIVGCFVILSMGKEAFSSMSDTPLIIPIIMILACAFGFIILPMYFLISPKITQDPSYLLIFIFAIITIIIMMIMIKLAPKRTERGNELLGKIRGFKNFLETAESQKLEALVNENPTYFYDILPYTYVLGISNNWIKKFESVAIPEPNWYIGNKSFDITSFGSFTNNTITAATRAMTSSPYSGGNDGIGSSSSSGSSGGGSSGGGSGGGGGGSW